jgi:hypothetical protein
MYTYILLIGLTFWFPFAVDAQRQPTPEIDVFTDRARDPEVYLSTSEVVPEGRHIVEIRINRANFTNPASRVSLRAEVLVRGQWELLHDSGFTEGGIKLRPDKSIQPFSSFFKSLPRGATEVRVQLTVDGQPARFRVGMRFF